MARNSQAERDHQQHRQVDDRVVAEEGPPDDRDVAEERQRPDRRLVEARIGLAELEIVQQRRQPLHAEGDADADHDLVEAEADAEQHDQRRDQRAAEPAERGTRAQNEPL